MKKWLFTIIAIVTLLFLPSSNAKIISSIEGYIFISDNDPASGWAAKLGTIFYCKDDNDCYYFLSGSHSLSARIGENGYFIIDEVPSGHYLLIIYDVYKDRIWQVLPSIENLKGKVNTGEIFLDKHCEDTGSILELCKMP